MNQEEWGLVYMGKHLVFMYVGRDRLAEIQLIFFGGGKEFLTTLIYIQLFLAKQQS